MVQIIIFIDCICKCTEILLKVFKVTLYYCGHLNKNDVGPGTGLSGPLLNKHL